MAPSPSDSPAQSVGGKMSARLLTMKFMQRALASPPSVADSSGDAEMSADEPSAKRRKLPVTDQDAVEAARRELEATRDAALTKHVTEAKDTRWVLDLPPTAHAKAVGNKASGGRNDKGLKVVYVGYGQIDEAIGGDGSKTGRIRTANFKGKEEEETDEKEDNTSESKGTGSKSKSAFISNGGAFSQSRGLASQDSSKSGRDQNAQKRKRDEWSAPSSRGSRPASISAGRFMK